MKTAGLLGGMSWESTLTYYQLLNQGVKARLGGLHSAQCLLYSVDFHALETNMATGAWAENAAILQDAARRLEGAGADFIVICTNTMHKLAPQIQAELSIPILHIAEVTADALLAQGLKRVALLGTRFTMEQDFYKSVLAARGLEVLIPDEAQRAEIDRVIFKELCLGELRPQSRAFYLDVIRGLGEKGAQGVILGCTEIGLLVRPEDTEVPLFDTTVLHAAAAVERLL